MAVNVSPLTQRRSPSELKENLNQIWNDHCLNKKPVLAKSRKRRPVMKQKKYSLPISEHINTSPDLINNVGQDINRSNMAETGAERALYVRENCSFDYKSDLRSSEP